MKKHWNAFRRNEEGQVMVLFALMLVVALGMAALVIDLGWVQISKKQLQNVADAAALAGAQDLPSESEAVASALIIAKENKMKVQKNRVTNEGDTIEITTPYDGDVTKIEVVCKRKVPYFFAQIFGFADTEVTVRTVAQKKGNLKEVVGLRPWALRNQYSIEQAGIKTWVDYHYTYGMELVLKDGGGDGFQGLYRIVGYGDQNPNAADIYKKNIADGYSGKVQLGDLVIEGSGNMNVKGEIDALMKRTGDTSEDYTKATHGNSRVVFIPKIDAHTKEVLGFAAIYLKSVDTHGNITVNFLYDTTWSEVEKSKVENWGLGAVKIVE
ncbi:hypothetical protein KCG48_02295 [Proteiniclasticum sp. BAD-10]|uniref:Putative Flp pilus-assembly TadG-like N-terminal domain-containing protein n=1 Tax=Proteiniclasticum sediminis TaxID=2804028 RepID=A0A941CPS8_9CLOT|nr:Tad domain-containing protein [Proteiniclasticum sediminis]MBR0575163.1 hypothetical protein [Proteiniclasticum sediminis]